VRVKCKEGKEKGVARASGSGTNACARPEIGVTTKIAAKEIVHYTVSISWELT
jgi:hypothetical protein